MFVRFNNSTINTRYRKNLQNHETKFVLERRSELFDKFSKVLTAKYQRSRLLSRIKLTIQQKIILKKSILTNRIFVSLRILY